MRKFNPQKNDIIRKNSPEKNNEKLNLNLSVSILTSVCRFQKIMNLKTFRSELVSLILNILN